MDGLQLHVAVFLGEVGGIVDGTFGLLRHVITVAHSLLPGCDAMDDINWMNSNQIRIFFSFFSLFYFLISFSLDPLLYLLQCCIDRERTMLVLLETAAGYGLFKVVSRVTTTHCCVLA